VDEWIVFDITQYTRKSWISRNRVLHPKSGWQYVSIPLQNSSIRIKITDARIADFADQERYVLGKISHYKKHAPYYAEVCGIIRSAFAAATDESLVALNVGGLRVVCQYLGLPFRYRVCSQLDFDYPDGVSAGQWAPLIARRLSAGVYVNPIGGQALFDPADFAKAGVRLEFLEFLPFAYKTPGYKFEGDLSILDVLMWNPPQRIIQTIQANASIVSTDGR
jgi:hypothetical protein